jgi:hypothetical protein
MVDRKKQAVDGEDGLSSVKIGVYTLIRLGLPLEDIVDGSTVSLKKWSDPKTSLCCLKICLG